MLTIESISFHDINYLYTVVDAFDVVVIVVVVVNVVVDMLPLLLL